MIKYKSMLILFIGMILIFFACAPRVAQAPEIKVIEKPETPQERASWEKEWQDLIKAAQKEGRLSIYSGLEHYAISVLRQHFGEKYGIFLEIVSASSSQLTPKIFMERQNGLYIPDLYMEGPTSPLLVFRPRGIILPLDKVLFRPDVLDNNIWRFGYGPYFDKHHTTVGGTANVVEQITFNRKMVRPEEITSYNDLLDSKWKGKILQWDPAISGGPASTMHDALIIMGEDYIGKLAEQAGLIIRDKRLLVEWVAREKFPISFGADRAIVQDFRKEGVTDLGQVVFKEGTALSATSVVALFDNAPHPNAARLFINWFLTKEAQEMYVIATVRASRRVDVSTAHLEPYQRVKEGVKYIVRDEEYYLNTSENQKIMDKYYKK